MGSDYLHHPDSLRDISSRIWAPYRFSRVFGQDGHGIVYRSAEELFALNPPVTKRVLERSVQTPEDYMVDAGTILMAYSGQRYGLIGTSRITTPADEGVFLSHDVIRITPDLEGIRPGGLPVDVHESSYVGTS